jgi:putative aminopeptidase FrvX
VKKVELLKKLSDAFGASGFEKDVKKIINDELKSFTDISYDGIGSIVCKKEGNSKGPKVMISAHIDELGLLVRYVNERGFIRFIPLGSWSQQALYGQKFVLKTKKGYFPAVVSTIPHHFWNQHTKEREISMDEMMLDCGAVSLEDAKERFGIEPGNPAVPDVQCSEFAEGNYLLGKGFDDRVGCAQMIESLKALEKEKHPNILYGVGTCQEEVGIRGAQTTSRMINPDVCIVLEGSPADDAMSLGALRPELQQGALDSGPQIRFYDPSMIANYKLGDLLKTTAEDLGIKYQIAIRTGGATDAGVIHKSNFGVPSIVLGTAVRYAHSPYTIISIADYENTLKLLVAVLKKLDWKMVKSLTE